MIFADAHVHIYDCFHLKVFLDSALGNLKKAANLADTDGKDAFFLLLTERSTENWFRDLHRRTNGETRLEYAGCGNWFSKPTEESFSLSLHTASNPPLFIVAGRQIVTRENLEILALFANADFKDGMELSQTILDVTAAGGISVIPWGPGKWTGKRGKVVQGMIKSTDFTAFFLGDNGNRSRFWPRPKLFRLAEERGIAVLPGSDPLPFYSEQSRAGSFGFFLSGSPNHSRPGTDLKRRILEPKFFPKAYGDPENPYRFARNQLKMQALKRFCR